MNVFRFLFLLSASFVIFGFIWAILKFVISAFTSKVKDSKIEYVLRIVKYTLLVTVSANIVNDVNNTDPLIHSSAARIILGSIVIGLYLLGKLQNKNKYGKFASFGGNFLKGLSTSFDPKTERFLIIGAMGLFAFLIQFPNFADNPIVNWFTSSISSLSNAFFIGFIFQIIALFSLINILMRGSNIIGQLVQGKSLSESIKNDSKQRRFDGAFSQFGGFGNQQQQQSNNQTQKDYTKKSSMNTDSEGFTDYEDVTDQ